MPRFTSWSSQEFSVVREGQPATIHVLLSAVSYSDSLESALVQGASRDILGTTDPVYVAGDMTIEMYESWFRTFAKDVTNNGETKLGDHDFVLITKRQSRTETTPRVDEVHFQILGAEDSSEAGSPEALVTTVTCLPTKIKRDGVEL